MLKSLTTSTKGIGLCICTCAHFASIALDMETIEDISSAEIIETERKPVKMGRKGFEIPPSVLQQIEHHAGMGFNMEQIATVIGLKSSTLYRKQSLFREIEESIKKGRLSAIGKVSNALFDSALSGNVTAQIFYLKNRAPEMYQDVVQQKFTVEAIGKLSDTQLLDEIRKDESISSQFSGLLPLPQAHSQSQDQT